MSKDVEKVTEPAPFLKGKFAIYETKDGGYHLVYRPDNVEEDQHVEIPGMYVKLMNSKMGNMGLGKAGLKKMMRGLVG